MSTTVGINDPLPMFRGGLRAALTRASFVVDEPVDIVKWADRADREDRADRADRAEGLATTGHAGGTGGRGSMVQRWAVLLSVATRTHWSVLDRLHDHRPDVTVVTLLEQPSEDSYRDALARGALSAAPRSAPSDHIVEVVRAAVAGRALLPAAVSKALAVARTAIDAGRLGDEERRWLRTLADGASVDDLAWSCGYSRRTMYRRLAHVYRRLGADRREGALLTALRTGLI